LPFRDTIPGQLSYEGKGEKIAREFYIPVLREAVEYDRATGYFSVESLVHAASGIAGLLKNAQPYAPSMRLILGAHDVPKELWEAYKMGIRSGRQVVEAIAERIASGLETVEDLLAKKRLEVLAWMFHEGHLEVKVVLPHHVLPTDFGIFHYKTLIFKDAHGDFIAAEGSANETEPAYTVNGERLVVFYSWREGDKERIDDTVRSFERIWGDQHPDFECFELPEAVRRAIIRWKPSSPPASDPEEEFEEAERKAYGLLPAARLVRLLARTKLLAHMGLGPVRLYPHQTRAVNLARSHYPFRVLFADEVGLGKTIEAAATLKLLWMTGYARRILVLTPKNVMRQWWDELRSKFTMPFHMLQSRSVLVNPNMEEFEVRGNPYNEADMIVASWHYARGRRGREPELLQARPFDLVVIDEAHNARVTRSMGSSKPTRLNELATELSTLTSHLFLVTATPQQLNELEVHDLLRILGVGGPWTHEEEFQQFYNEAKVDPASRTEQQWLHMFRMAQWFSKTYLTENDVDRVLDSASALGESTIQRFRQAFKTGSEQEFSRALKEARGSPAAMDRVIRGLSPISWFMVRHNRPMLEEIEYRFPQRVLLIRDVNLDRKHTELLADLQKYLQTEYDAYRACFRKTEHQKGLGLIRSVYHQRFISSFSAAYHTVERRREFLEALLEGDEERLMQLAEKMLEDVEMDDYDVDDLVRQMGMIVESARKLIEAEIRTLSKLESRLKTYSSAATAANDPKLRTVREVVYELRAEGRKVLVFSKFTDTVDVIRDFLAKEVGASKVGAYTGRGGELWDGSQWKICEKEHVQKALEEELDVLVCSDAASEGLNLQAASAVVNVDMPWNPAKVEQRIGRVDRIGQTSPDVKVVNVWYPETYEARMYRVVIERFGNILNILGPIMYIVNESLTEAFLRGLGGEELRRKLQETVNEIERRKDEAIKSNQILTSQVTLKPAPQEQELVNGLREFIERASQALGVTAHVKGQRLFLEPAERLPSTLRGYAAEGVSVELGRPNALVPGHPIVQWVASQLEAVARDPEKVPLSAYGVGTPEGLFDLYAIREGDKVRKLSSEIEAASLLREMLNVEQ